MESFVERDKSRVEHRLEHWSDAKAEKLSGRQNKDDNDDDDDAAATATTRANKITKEKNYCTNTDHNQTYAK